MRKIGIFSGSFDPVHAGHIAFAEEAAKKLGLETVVFMPETFPRGKPNITPVSERLAELEISLANTRFVVLDAKADRFTVHKTLPELEALYPDATFTFLVGSDVALNVPNWSQIERLTSRFDFAVGMRSGDSKKAVETALDSAHASYKLVQTSFSHLSSKNLRRS